MNIKLFTHTDLDGVGSVILLKLTKCVTDLSVEYCDPKNIDKKVVDFLKNEELANTFDRIFITDLFVTKETADIIQQFNEKYSEFPEFDDCDLYNVDDCDLYTNTIDKVRLYDHHLTGAYLNEYSFATVQDTIDNSSGKKECAAHLFFNEISSTDTVFDELKINDERCFERLEYLFELIRLWDTWEWKDLPADDSVAIESCDLNQLFHITPKKDFIDSIIESIEFDEPIVSREDSRRIKYANMQKDNYLNQKIKALKIMSIGEYSYGVVFAERFISELGNKICGLPDIDIAAIIIPDINQVSLRTSQDSEIDLSKIAESYGGGGHEKASGFGYDINLSFDFIGKIFGSEDVRCYENEQKGKC